MNKIFSSYTCITAQTIIKIAISHVVEVGGKMKVHFPSKLIISGNLPLFKR